MNAGLYAMALSGDSKLARLGSDFNATRTAVCNAASNAASSATCNAAFSAAWNGVCAAASAAA